MAYYMRFLVEDGEPLALEQVASGLRDIDPEFRVDADGVLHRADQTLGRLVINRTGEDLFRGEVEEFLDAIEETPGLEATGLAGRLRRVSAILCVEVLFWQGRTADETLDLLDPLWAWLEEHRRGLLQADGEGFYEQGELIAAVR